MCRVDDLYQFLQLWVPQLYGDVDDMDLAIRGFELVDSDTELWPDDAIDAEHSKENRSSTSSAGELAGELTRESWEVGIRSLCHQTPTLLLLFGFYNIRGVDY